MKRFIVALVVLSVCAGRASVGAESDPRPKIGSGKVAAYVSSQLSDPDKRAETIEWVVSEAQRIRERSPLLYRLEQKLTTIDWSDENVVSTAVELVVEATGATEWEVRDGAAIVLATSFAEPLPRKKPGDSGAKGGAFSASEQQRTELRRRGVVGDEEIDRYLRDQATEAPSRKAARIRGRLAGVRAFQQRAAAEQEVINASALAQAVNAQQQARPYYAPPPAWYAPLSPGPFYETVSHAGNQTYVSGFGPFGAFGETISQNGGQTYISGYGMPPYAGVGPGF